MSRELLEKAAKAAGLTGYWSETLGGWPCLILPSGHAWQPQHDDGDAFRLESKLWLDVKWYAGFVTVSAIEAHGVFVTEKFFDHNGDRDAARRLASTRAAAAIGEKP